MKLKITNYFYYNSKDFPILNLCTREKDGSFRLIVIKDKENLRPHIGVRKQKWEEFKTRHIELFDEVLDEWRIHDWKNAPISLFGEEVVDLQFQFPWQVGKFKRDGPFKQTFYGDVKWEKMAVSKMINYCKLDGPYIEVPERKILYGFMTLDDIVGVDEDEFFLVDYRICSWDIETDARNLPPRDKYEQYKDMPIVSITTHDNYENRYYEFVWHPEFEDDITQRFENHTIKQEDDEIVIDEIIRYERTTEEKMLKEFFKYFGKKRYDILYGYFSEGGYKLQGGFRKWVNGFDTPMLYARSKELGLLEEMQNMSPCPIITKSWSDKYEGVYLRTGRNKKREVVIKGVSQIDYVFCYSDDTEILTKEDGWILFKDLTKQHKVACLSQDDHTMYWHKPSAIHKFRYDNKMIHTNHRSVDLLVTPNHRMYVRKKWKKKYEFIEARNCNDWSALKMKNSVEWNGNEKKEFELPYIHTNAQNKRFDLYHKKVNTDDFLEFLGWYIAEGHCYKTKKGSYQIGISQSNEKKRNEIIDCIKRMGYNYVFSNKNKRQIQIYNKQLCLYLEKLGKAHQKYIPKEFMNLSKRQLKILFDALIKGDGSVYKNTKRYYTTSKRLADQIQEIAIKLGYNSTLFIQTKEKRNSYNTTIGDRKIVSKRDMYSVCIRTTKECEFNNSKYDHYFEEVDYNGYVYCCSVPEDIILVRRNGKPMWCGNTDEVIDFARKHYDFRGGRLEDWMEFFLDFEKLDKQDRHVWEYWMQNDISEDQITMDELLL